MELDLREGGSILFYKDKVFSSDEKGKRGNEEVVAKWTGVHSSWKQVFYPEFRSQLLPDAYKATKIMWVQYDSLPNRGLSCVYLRGAVQRVKKKLPPSFFLGSPLPGWMSMCPSIMSGSIDFALHSINMSGCRNLTFSPIISISLLWNLAPQDCCAGRQGCGEDLHSSGDLKVLRIAKKFLLFLTQCEHICETYFSEACKQLLYWGAHTDLSQRRTLSQVLFALLFFYWALILLFCLKYWKEEISL